MTIDPDDPAQLSSPDDPAHEPGAFPPPTSGTQPSEPPSSEPASRDPSPSEPASAPGDEPFRPRLPEQTSPEPASAAGDEPPSPEPASAAGDEPPSPEPSSAAGDEPPSPEPASAAGDEPFRPRLPEQVAEGSRPITSPSVTAAGTPTQKSSSASKSQGGKRRPHAKSVTGTAAGELMRALLFPGVSTMGRLPVVGFVLVLLGVAFPLVMVGALLLDRRGRLDVVLDDRFLVAVIVAGVAFVLARFVAVTEVAMFRQRHHNAVFPILLAYLVLAAMAIPVGFAVLRVEEARELFDDLFPDDRTSAPLYVPTPPPEPTLTSVLLLGSDAGPDRFGDRTDTMILVTVHRPSGRASLISIPRNLMGLQFPPTTLLGTRFPTGFTDLANAVYPYVDRDESLHAEFQLDGLPPAELAVSQAVGHSLGAQIDDFVFVDMVGFMDLIDVLGGVTVDVEGVVPLPPNIIGAKREIPPSVGPGPVEMDGTLAVAYARARYTDSDYARMGRQRQILAALAEQTSVLGAFAQLPELADALAASLRTSTSRNDFAQLSRVLSDGNRIVESVGLVPPLIRPGSPDYAMIRQIVAAVHRALITGEPSGYTAEPDPAG